MGYRQNKQICEACDTEYTDKGPIDICPICRSTRVKAINEEKKMICKKCKKEIKLEELRYQQSVCLSSRLVPDSEEGFDLVRVPEEDVSEEDGMLLHAECGGVIVRGYDEYHYEKIVKALT